MNIFIQGMRRSGTTILFDILSMDPYFDCYYEPFAAANKEAIGGGSGIRNIDYFEKINKLRSEFIKKFPEIKDSSFLNFGAPRDAQLEFEKDMPNFCIEYIRSILNKSPSTLIKFTRMYNKVPILKNIDQNAKFIHIVRDPKAVTTSYLYGKNKKNKNKFKKNELFFNKKSNRTPWSSFDFSEIILSDDKYKNLTNDIKDFERILLVWKYTFNKTHSSGIEYFGDNYHLILHDSLISNTELNLKKLYNFIGKNIPDEVMTWAKKFVKKEPNVHEIENVAWIKAFKKLGIVNELDLMSRYRSNC